MLLVQMAFLSLDESFYLGDNFVEHLHPSPTEHNACSHVICNPGRFDICYEYVYDTLNL